MPVDLIKIPIYFVYVPPFSAAIIFIYFIINALFLRICKPYMKGDFSIFSTGTLLSFIPSAVSTGLIFIKWLLGMNNISPYVNFAICSLLIPILNSLVFRNQFKNNKFNIVIFIFSVVINLPYLFLFDTNM